MMKPNCLSILLLCALLSSALRIPFGQSKRSLQPRAFGYSQSKPIVNAVTNDGDGDANLSTPNDLIYLANVTVGGSEYLVQLDTGSSEFWVKGNSFPLPNVTHTDTTLNLTYGIGWAFGNIATAEIEFAGITIPKQALLDVSRATNPALQYGAQGVLGLGFTSLSNIDHSVNATGGNWGRSVLYNAFLDNPNEPNYITFALQRTEDPDKDVHGVFTIGEIDEKYANIKNANAISTWPVENPRRWNILLDAFMIGTDSFKVSTNVSGAPSDKSVVLIDSGTSYSYVSTNIAQSIYGKVDGATYDSKQGLWTVPCSAEVDMAVQFGGTVYPLHPLDVVVTVDSMSTCIGSFIPQPISVGSGQFDWILGDNFLRSVYTMYDFGDFDSSGKMGNPYVKLLALVDPNDASSEFVSVRGGTARSNFTYNAADGASSESESPSVSDSGSIADKLNDLVGYIPAMLAIMTLNALALLLVGIAGVVFLCRRCKRKNSKKGRGLLLDHRTTTPHPGTSSGNASGDHEYERVSMHAPPGEQGPEDIPFAPPEPAFRAFEDDTLHPLPPSSHPRPTFGGIGIPRDYRVSAAGSDVTAVMPPSPGFKTADRPKSVA